MQLASHQVDKSLSTDMQTGIVTVVSGEWVEGQPTGENTFSSEGYGSFPENENTVHWVYNRTDSPATALDCDIAKAK